MKKHILLYPCKINVLRGMLESACLSVCLSVCVSVCVQNASFCQSSGWDVKSHLVTALVYLVVEELMHLCNMYDTKQGITQLKI